MNELTSENTKLKEKFLSEQKKISEVACATEQEVGLGKQAELQEMKGDIIALELKNSELLGQVR